VVDDPNEADSHREITSEWEHLADRLPVVKVALKEYDWTTDRETTPV